MKTNQLVHSAIALCLFGCIGFLVACSSDDSGGGNTLLGVFTDSPVEGLSYSATSTSGTTDAAGTFEYVDGEMVTFSIGGITLGGAFGAAELSPLDISGLNNADLSTMEVRNIASLLQSLDSDVNPDNGITISSETSSALSSASLDFSSGSFFWDLYDLVNDLNSENSTSLVAINQNAAGLHLAQSLGIENQFDYLPRSVLGRDWEDGVFYAYNTAAASDPDREYQFDVRGNELRYHFGDNLGFYLIFSYTQDTQITGEGNLYSDLDQDPPVTTSGGYIYRNRITTPGFTFDYNGVTFMGYYNFYKTAGVTGQLQGTYLSKFDYDQQRSGEDPEYRVITNSLLTISEPNSAMEYDVLLEYRDENDVVTDTRTTVVTINDLNNEMVFLVNFRGIDYLFFDSDFTTNGIDYPSLTFSSLYGTDQK